MNTEELINELQDLAYDNDCVLQIRYYGSSNRSAVTFTPDKRERNGNGGVADFKIKYSSRVLKEDLENVLKDIKEKFHSQLQNKPTRQSH